MPRKKFNNKEQELSLKKKLDNILLSNEMLSDLSIPDIPPINDQAKEIRKLDIDNLKLEVESEARIIVEALSKFYNDIINVSDDHYIKHKQKIDSLNISTMVFQIRTSQHAITKLIEEIDDNPSNARLFEVLAQLQHQLMQLPKNFSSYLSQMEKNYKELKKEYEEIKDNEDIQFDENGQILLTEKNLKALRVRGTKTLMKDIQKKIKENNINEIPLQKPDNSLTDPKIENELSNKIDEKEEELNIEDEFFE